MRIFHEPGHAAHESHSELAAGKFVRSFECPERMGVILAALAEAGLPEPEAPGEVPRALLETVHDPDYLVFLEGAHARWLGEGRTGDAIPYTFPTQGLTRIRPPDDIDGALGYWGFSMDSGITAGTWTAARASAACAHHAALAAAEGPAFALARPPGHHAHRDLYGGYCYINNAAVAVETLIGAGAARVAVLDIDYHHGNGTQAIFWERGDVLVVNLHADPAVEFPYFLGRADETGEGAGRGKTLNLPMPFGTGIEVWSEALEAGLRAIADHRADALVVSLGVDTFEADPISRFKLRTEDYGPVGARIRAAGLPTVFVMEGGYAVDALGRNVAGVLTGFLDA